jgi:hypothetical protein
MSVRSSIIVVLSLLSAFSAAQDAATNAPVTCTSGVCELTATLSGVDLARPIADLERNLSVGDRRFIGINGYSCFPPGVDKADEPWSPKFGIRCLPGTSDVIEGDAHLALINKATKYAQEYNVELLRRIRAGLVT